MVTIVLTALAVTSLYLIVVGTYDVTVSTNYSGPINALSARTVSSKVREEAAPTVLPAIAGTLTTRTNGTSGVVTLTAGHGFTTGQKVDLYWTGGKAQRATLGTVTSTTAPIASVLSGDALPAADSTINLAPLVQSTFSVEGDDVRTFVLTTAVAGYFRFYSTSGTTDTLEYSRYVEPGNAFGWDVDGGIDNPLEGMTISKVEMSQSGVSNSTTQMLAAAYRN